MDRRGRWFWALSAGVLLTDCATKRVAEIALALVALALVVGLYYRTSARDRLRIAALALVAGGAAGNLADRLRSAHGVVDFIDVGLGSWRFWTFNVADIGVTAGALLLAWALAREDARSGPPHAAA